MRSKIRMSVISSYCNLVTGQTERRICETNSSSFVLWKVNYFGKQEVLDPDVSKLPLKFINSLEQEPEPRLSLPPPHQEFPTQHITELDSCILSLAIPGLLYSCLPNSLISRKWNEISSQNNYTRSLKNRFGVWKQWIQAQQGQKAFDTALLIPGNVFLLSG